MKKILCPTDFSETAQNAVTYAAKLSKASGASLTLVNIQPISPALVSDKELILHAVGERLEELGKEIRQFFKIGCDVEIVMSPSLLSEAVAQRADDFDLLVMGTHGVANLIEFFTGSNTYHAIRKSKIPVMLIPSDCMYSEIQRVVYAYDYLLELKLPVKQLQPWIKRLESDVTILQVNDEAVSQAETEEMKELQFILGGEWRNEGVNIQFDTIRSAETASGIHSYMQRNQQDVLALCTIHRNFIESFFHKSVIKVISEIANYPVFVFHE